MKPADSDSPSLSATVLDEGGTTGTHPPHHLYRIARLDERFAAFLVDGVINATLIGAWGFFLSRFLGKPVALRGSGAVLFFSTACALYFLYYLFFEGVLTATPGKMLGGLIVHKKGGGVPSLFSIFIRNLLRLVDTPFFFVTGLGLMESGRKCRRLGDLMAGTVVLRKMGFRKFEERNDSRGGNATLRTLAFGLDLLLILCFGYGLFFLIPMNHPTVALILLNGIPLFLLLYLSLTETFFQSTCGKALAGLKVVCEDGQPASFTAVFVRNFFRPFDLNPLGYLAAVLSSRKQRLGDLLAGTRVIRASRRWRLWLAVPAMLLPAAAAGILGWVQPQSAWRQGWLVQAGGKTFEPVPPLVQRYLSTSFRLEEIKLGPPIDERRQYDRGEVVFVFLRVSGFATRNHRSWLQADLQVRDPRGNVVLDRANVINSNRPVHWKKALDLATRFALHPQAFPGPYQIDLTVRDRFGNNALKKTLAFRVK